MSVPAELVSLAAFAVVISYGARIYRERKAILIGKLTSWIMIAVSYALFALDLVSHSLGSFLLRAALVSLALTEIAYHIVRNHEYGK